jgi:Cysteine-rich secretory protein family
MRGDARLQFAFPAALVASAAVGCAASSPPGSFNPGDDGTSSPAADASMADQSSAGSGSGGDDGAAGSSGQASSSGGGTSPANGDAGAGPTDAGTPRADTGAGKSDAAAPMKSADGGCVQPLDCMISPAPSSGDVRQDCVDRINQFRTQCACLPPLQRWTDGEACADTEAQYDSMQPSQSAAHAGFIHTETVCSQSPVPQMWASCCSPASGFLPAGPSAMAQDECPGYPNNAYVVSACLQQMWNEGPPPESVQACENDSSCFEMHGHFINMTSTQSTKVACGFYTTSSGTVWSTQNFAP